MFKSFMFYLVLALILLPPSLLPASDFHFAGEEFPPFSYTKDENIKGISVDILREIFREQGMPDTIALYPWARAYEIALNRKNSAVFTTARTTERENLFKWVGPIAPRRIVLYKLKSRTDIRAATILEAQTYVVGSITGFAAEKTLLNNGFQKGKNLQSVPVIEQNLKKLFSGRIDMMTALDISLPFIMEGTGFQGDQLEEVIVLDEQAGFYFAFNKESDNEVVAEFQAALDRMKKDGRYQAIMQAYQRK